MSSHLLDLDWGELPIPSCAGNQNVVSDNFVIRDFLYEALGTDDVYVPAARIRVEV